MRRKLANNTVTVAVMFYTEKMHNASMQDTGINKSMTEVLN